MGATNAAEGAYRRVNPAWNIALTQKPAIAKVSWPDAAIEEIL